VGGSRRKEGTETFYIWNVYDEEEGKTSLRMVKMRKILKAESE
jgi:hypothetical protein